MINLSNPDTTQQSGGTGCPVVPFPWDSTDGPALTRHELLDGLRRAAPVSRVDEGIGFVVVSRYEDVLKVAQSAAAFPQLRRMLENGEPQPFLLIPEQLDGTEHTTWRRLLGPYFSPGRITQWDKRITARANALIDGFIDQGHCDFVNDFALRYPTAIFLEMMGLPLEHLDRLLEWETVILHPQGAVGEQKAIAAMGEVFAYFSGVIAERRALPPAERPAGIVTEALSWRIADKPIPDQDLLSFYLMMFMAGLDTVTAELGYAFLHLALHDADRASIVEHPELIPNAVEELLRLYPIVNTPRQAAEDTEIAGCPVSTGEVVMISFPSAGRDDARYADALTADFTRSDMSHLTFGAGPHRCLGSHLARHEMEIAYREWHRRIPHYRVRADAPSTETAGIMLTLNTLPLEWDLQ